MDMIHLGLDLSSTTCGWALTENKKIIDAGFFDISKVKTYKEKAKIIMDGLVNKKFEVVNIEETLSGFAMGRTRQQTILMLAKNKAVISYILEEAWKIKINFANATTMRKQLFGKARIKGMTGKEYVKSRIEAMYDVSAFQVVTKRGNTDKRIEDIYDAIVVSCYTSV